MIEKQLLCDFFDGEHRLTKKEQEQQLSDFFLSAESQMAWQSFTLTRDVLRQTDSQESVSWDIAQRVAAALENEPALKLLQESVILEEQPLPAKASKLRASWLAPVLQMGIAASVASVVIFGVQQYQGEDAVSLPPRAQPAVLQTMPISGMASPVSFNRQSVQNESKIVEQERRVYELFQDFELQQRVNSKPLDKSDKDQGLVD
ncbi:MAG: anti sigma-E factor RseA C-terminal domain-containing protein [Enterovibrio sp.]